MNVIITGEDSVVSKALVQVMKLFYDAEFIPPDNKGKDIILKKSISTSTGIIAVCGSNETREKTNSIFSLLGSDSNVPKETIWITLPLDTIKRDLTNEASFPPDLAAILKVLRSPDYRIKSLSPEESILANRDILIEKITILKHDLQNKIPTCKTLCEKKKNAFKKEKDFKNLKREIKKFIANIKSNRNYTYTINKGVTELLKTFQECGVNLQHIFPEVKKRIDKTTKFIVGFWDNFQKEEDLEAYYQGMEELSQNLDELRTKLKTFTR